MEKKVIVREGLVKVLSLPDISNLHNRLIESWAFAFFNGFADGNNQLPDDEIGVMKFMILAVILITFPLVCFSDEYESEFKKGTDQMAAGKLKDAVNSFTKAIELHPNTKAYYSPQVSAFYEMRGIAQARLNETKKAISDFDKSIELNPNALESYYNRGGVYGKIGNEKQAIEDIITSAKMGFKPAQDFLRKNGVQW